MNYKNYKEGDTSELGIPIFKIIGISEHIVVYFDDEYALVYEFEKEEVTTDAAEVNIHCQSLKQEIPEGIPDRLLRELRRELGHCLFNALKAPDLETSRKLFEPFNAKLSVIKSPEYAAIEYISISLIISVIFTLPLISMYFYFNSANWEWAIVFVCSIAGIFGSLFSVLQRNISCELDLKASRGLVVMQSMSRVMSGMLAALILYLASNSNIALGFASDNQYALMLFCVLAGFSERLIPDLFNKLEENA